jgi:type I restriction-modification system DNA methylase subunit
MLGGKPGATDRQRVISEIFRNKDRTIIASETNLLDALDRVQLIAEADLDDTHFFAISQAFEGLLPALGEKKNDGGQFFTPREVIRVIVAAVAPVLGRTVYDPCCGTGGFLIQTHEKLAFTEWFPYFAEIGRRCRPAIEEALARRGFMATGEAKIIDNAIMGFMRQSRS